MSIRRFIIGGLIALFALYYAIQFTTYWLAGTIGIDALIFMLAFCAFVLFVAFVVAWLDNK